VPGLIDLHCHLLPGVDDGALDLDDSVAMARRAAREGIEAICATPHIRADHDVRIGQLAGRVAALGEELARREIPVRVLPGGEVAQGAVAGLSDADLAAVALAGGPWVLLEPLPGPLAAGLAGAVGSLAGRGHRALIAHPERHLGPDLFELLGGLVAQGALVQATAAFFEPGVQQDGMIELARRGLVHVLGSDAHSSHGGRPVSLQRAVDVLATVERVGPHVEWIAREAPAAIVRGEVPAVPYPAG
jgi:protein-tyrosine phosphatase